MKNAIKILLAIIVISGRADSRYYNGAPAIIDSSLISDNRPDKPKDHAKVARYIVHKSDWGAVGTISTESAILGFPMVNIISIADSPRFAPSTGHIYFLLTNLDFTGKDLTANNKMTMMVTNDQDMECTKNGLDPMEPTCGRIMLSGSITVLKNSTSDFKTGFASFMSRHPAAVNWIGTHSFYLCTLEIQQIAVLDWYGGPHFPTVEEYYNANESDFAQLKGDKDHKKIHISLRDSGNELDIDI